MTSIIQNVIANHNPVGCYSIRKLVPSYGGYCLRVRRSSDNTELDVSFVSALVGSLVDTAAILTFCGAGNGFVTKWYDQFENLKDIVQSTAGEQPQIVVGGALRTINSRPGVFFNGNTGQASLYCTTGIAAQPISFSAVCQSTNSAGYQVMIDAIFPSTNRVVINNGGNGVEKQFLTAPTKIISSSANSAVLNTNLYVANGASSFIYRNNSQVASGNTGATSLVDNFRVGNNDNSSYQLNGPICELIIYNGLLSTDERNYIHNNQKSFYSTP